MMDTPKSPERKPGLPADLEEWFSENPGEDRAGLENVWRLAAAAELEFQPDAARLARLKETLDAKLGLSEIRRSRQGGPFGIAIVSRRSWWAAAAAVLVLAIAGWLVVPVTKKAHVGDIRLISLSDGSAVTLNSGSAISHARTFGWLSRSVSLKGEAFFRVEPGAGTFAVETFNGRVEVTGTRFNVRAWSGDRQPETSVFVEEGEVRVSSEEPGTRVVALYAGESAVIRSSSVEKTIDEPQLAGRRPSWQDGGMAFSDKPLGDVLDEIERRFGVSVTTIPVELRDRNVSLFLRRVEEPGTVLELISAAHQLQVAQTQTGFKLSAR